MSDYRRVFLGGVWGEYPFLRVLRLAVSPLRRVPFANAQKEPKRWAPAFGTSLWLGVPSLRDSSGGIAYGLLRCTSSRCVWLRQTALRAHPRINPSTQPSDGAGTSKAVLELTLIVLSGEGWKPAFFCRGLPQGDQRRFGYSRCICSSSASLSCHSWLIQP